MNFSCNFRCGVLLNLRDECTRSCTSIGQTCSANFPDVAVNSTAFFASCEDWCCSETNSLAVAMFCVLGVVAVLFAVFMGILFKKCARKRHRERMMEKTAWRPPTRDAFHEGSQRGGDDGELIPPPPPGDGAPTGDRYNSYIAGDDLEQIPGFSRVDPNARRSVMYDGEISLGFADEDFLMIEADRADGVSMAGSHMSRRSIQRSGALEMAAVRDATSQPMWPTGSQASSQQLSPRSDAGNDHAPPGMTGAAATYWNSTDHRGRPLSANALRVKAQQQQQQLQAFQQTTPPPSAGGGGVSPQAATTYVGIGGKTPPVQRPLSSSRRQSTNPAVTFDVFDDLDLGALDQHTSSRRGSTGLLGSSLQRSGSSAFGMGPPPPLPPPPPPPPTEHGLHQSGLPSAPPPPSEGASLQRALSNSQLRQQSSDYLWDVMEVDSDIFGTK